jgi:WD40 repeat protein
MSQLAKNLLVQGALVYSPDGEKIVLTRGRTSYLIDAASGAETRISDDAWVSDWSGDGKYLISSNVSGQMVIIPVADSGKPFSLVEGGFRGRFSPDGKWIAYISGRGGLGPVRIVPFTGGPSKSTGIQVSPGDGREPRWSRDGKELFYISSGNQLMATPVSLGPSVSVGIPKALIPVPAGTSYEVSQDGKRFLLNPQVGETPPEPPLTVLLNWPSILRRN